MGSSRKISLFEDLLCQVNFSSHLVSSMETSAYKNMSEKQPTISDGEIQIFGQYVVAESSPESHCHLKLMSNNCHDDPVELDHRKRSPPGGDLHQRPLKREKYLDLSNEAISFVLPSKKDARIDPPSVSEAAFHKRSSIGDVLHEDTSGSTSSLSWVSCNTSDEDYRSELPFHTVSSPHLVDRTEQPIVCTHILDHYPRKEVARGPNHQADIPDWKPRHSEMLKDEDDVNEKRLMGSCIIPMPDQDRMTSMPIVSVDCDCHDSGSINCIKRHVMEAREKIKTSCGPAQFIELGFPDMGESVALRWREEEEQVFREVVAANPASLGKNFWSLLPKFLPSKSSKDLVSYYFNVFILRKRAEQNSLDPSNIDSDNDEWQDDCECDVPVKMTDEHAIYDDDSHDENDEEMPKDFLGHGLIHDGHQGIAIQDESCTSFEGQNNLMVTQRQCEAMNGMVDHGYLVSSEAKPWDLGYFSGQENSVDFLPTCHVIEEVLGEGSWAANKSNGDDQDFI